MALHGELKINHHVIGEWEAVRKGVHEGDFIYRCKIGYDDTLGYSHDRTFFVLHNYDDGAVVLTAKVMLAAVDALEGIEYTENTAWSDFCNENNVPYYILVD